MSFLHPGRLWLLVGVVAVVAAYVAIHLRHRRAVARYVAADLHASVAPDRLGWRRHVAPGLAGVALAVVVLGIAQPARAEQVARDEGVVVLTVDVSASMSATDIAPNRLAAAIEGASGFVEDIPEGIQVGLVAFDGTARVLVDPTTDHASVVDAVHTLTTGPRTATGDAIATSVDLITSTLPEAALEADDVPATVVLLSDGHTTVGRSPTEAARRAADLRIPVTTIAYGTPTGTVAVQGQVVEVPADTSTMQQVADLTGGDAFEATTAGELDAAYEDIGTVVGHTTEQRDISRAFFGAGLGLLLVSAPLAMTWAARAL
jgi:Ca-activated chloride channel homolog